MGSISKPPKAPTINYITPTTTTGTTSPVVSTGTEPTKTDAQLNAEAREGSLLRRSRGRFGTITTSFRGFLDSAYNNAGAKVKTLLGE